jgi:hypothetical protein
MKKRDFSPVEFLSALGAGGIAVSNFALINYSLEHGKGLVTYAQTHSLASGFLLKIYSFLEVNMLVFASIHIILTVVLFKRLYDWLKASRHKEIMNNTLANSAIVAPFISAAMTMNVFIAAIRYFVPWLSTNLQTLMLPALVVWGAIWAFLIYVEIKLLKISIISSFDTSKLNFGWLLQPFALGMVTVTGAGIAAMAKSAFIANTAAFMVLVSGSMGLFLFFIKLLTVFKTYFSGEGKPPKEFLPSFLIVVPITTIYAIAFFRLGHFLDSHHGAHLETIVMLIMTAAFAFETWYLLFGFAMMKNFLKEDFRREYHISQWGLVCPLVAYAVLGSFVYKLFFAHVSLFSLLVFNIGVVSILFFFLLIKQTKCYKLKTQGLICS